LAEAIAATLPGQAHFAALADPFLGRTCRECQFWKPVLIRRRRNPETGEMEARPPLSPYGADGVLRTRRCTMAQTFAGKTLQRRIPHSARACRYFETAHDPLPVHQPESEASEAAASSE
jgi:hypothetical protein